MAITHYIEVGGTIISILSAIAILRKKKYLANTFLAIASLLVGVYLISIFIYDIINEFWAVNLFLRIGMISLLFSSLLFFYTMFVMMKSSKLFYQSKIVYINLALCLAGSVYFSVTDFISLQDSYVGNVNIQIDIIPLAIMVLILLYFMITSIIITINFGLKKIPKHTSPYKKISMYLYGLSCFIVGLFINIVSQITSNDYLGAICDVLYMSFIVLGLICLSYSVIGKFGSKNE